MQILLDSTAIAFLVGLIPYWDKEYTAEKGADARRSQNLGLLLICLRKV